MGQFSFKIPIAEPENMVRWPYRQLKSCLYRCLRAPWISFSALPGPVYAGIHADRIFSGVRCRFLPNTPFILLILFAKFPAQAFNSRVPAIELGALQSSAPQAVCSAGKSSAVGIFLLPINAQERAPGHGTTRPSSAWRYS